MTTRTAEVKLKLDGNQYRSELKLSEHDTRSMDRAVTDLDRDVKKIPPDAAKAAAALKLLGTETSLAGDKVKGFGQGTTVIKTFEDRIKQLRQEVQALAIDFQRTGSVQSFQNLIRSQSQLRELENMARGLTPTFRGIGSQAGTGFLGGFGEVLSAGAPVLVPMLAALIAEAAAAAGGAALGVAGFGGLITGSIIQAKTDPQVASALGGFGHWLMTELGTASTPFASYMEEGVKILEGDLAPVIHELGLDFQFLAPYIKIFAVYLGIAAQDFMPGFSKALHEAGPVLAVIAQQLPYLAQAVASFFHQIGEGGRGGAEAIALLMHALAAFIVGTGYFIHFMENLFHIFVVGIKHLVDFLAGIPGVGHLFTGIKNYVDDVATAYDKAAAAGDIFSDSMGRQTGQFDAFTAGLNHTTTALNDQAGAVLGLVQAWEGMFDKHMAVDLAAMNLRKTEIELTDSIKQNGRTFDVNTKAGQNNYDVLLRNIDNAKRVAAAEIDAGTSASQAASEFQGTYNALIDQAKQAGLTAAQVQYLAIQYGSLAGILASMGGKTVDTARIARNAAAGFGVHQGLRTGGIVSFADAGIYRDSMGPLIQFAEPGTGQEGFVPQKGIGRDRAGSILAPMAGWHGYGLVDYSGFRGASGGGSGPQVIQLQVSAVDGASAGLLKMIRIEVRGQGGNAAALGITR